MTCSFFFSLNATSTIHPGDMEIYIAAGCPSYIKDNPKYIQNYRPIAFASKIFKLHSLTISLTTNTLTNLLTSHREHYKILHNIQVGFRPIRNTTRQLQTIIVALKGAKCMNNDIYIAYIDFQNAIAHACILAIMAELGCPKMLTTY